MTDVMLVTQVADDMTVWSTTASSPPRLNDVVDERVLCCLFIHRVVHAGHKGQLNLVTLGISAGEGEGEGLRWRGHTTCIVMVAVSHSTLHQTLSSFVQCWPSRPH